MHGNWHTLHVLVTESEYYPEGQVKTHDEDIESKKYPFAHDRQLLAVRLHVSQIVKLHKLQV